MTLDEAIEHQQLCTGLAQVRAARGLLRQAAAALRGHAGPAAVEGVRGLDLALAAVEECVLRNTLEARSRLTEL